MDGRGTTPPASRDKVTQVDFSSSWTCSTSLALSRASAAGGGTFTAAAVPAAADNYNSTRRQLAAASSTLHRIDSALLDIKASHHTYFMFTSLRSWTSL